MSLTKRRLEYQEEQDLVNKWIIFLLNREEITDPTSQGIAKQIISKGLASLSEAQQRVYDKYLRPLTMRNCDCGCQLEPEDIEEGDGLCSYCRHLFSKDD